MAAERELRVSQGGEGQIRRVTAEEQRALRLAALLDGRSDVASQAAWDLARDHLNKGLARMRAEGLIGFAESYRVSELFVPAPAPGEREEDRDGA